VIKYLHQIGVIAATDPLADADSVVVDLAVVEAFGPGDGRGEPNLLVRWLLVDDVRKSIGEGHFDDSGLHGMPLVMFGKQGREDLQLPQPPYLRARTQSPRVATKGCPWWSRRSHDTG